VYNLNIVPLLPPAPAALVLVGRRLLIFSLRSAAALRRSAVLGPPGGVGELGRPMAEDRAEVVSAGEEGGGESDWEG
jgi:hypothetical protein